MSATVSDAIYYVRRVDHDLWVIAEHPVVKLTRTRVIFTDGGETSWCNRRDLEERGVALFPPPFLRRRDGHGRTAYSSPPRHIRRVERSSLEYLRELMATLERRENMLAYRTAEDRYLRACAARRTPQVVVG